MTDRRVDIGRKLHVLVVDTYYPGYVDGIYAAHPGLAQQPLSTQLNVLHAGLFAESWAQVDALEAMGHKARHHIVGVPALDAAWRQLSGQHARFRARSTWRTLTDRVEWESPDLVYVGMVDTLPEDVVKRIRKTSFVMGQVATALPSWDLDCYDVIVSSIPAMVAELRDRRHVNAAYLPLAFEPRVLEMVPPRERDVAVSFIGSLNGPQHAHRREVVHVARHNPPMWIRSDAHRNAVYGREMYELLARSRLTLNVHAKVAQGAANNLRMFEATGMGTLLVTDAAEPLFTPGVECVVYDSPDDAADKIAYYAYDHREEGEEIAKAGQARTLREHTWPKRMEQALAIAANPPWWAERAVHGSW